MDVHCCQEHAGIGKHECAWFDLQLELSPCLRCKLLQRFREHPTYFTDVGPFLIGHAVYLEAPAQVHCHHRRKLAAKVKAEIAHVVPHFGVGAAANVRVYPLNHEVVLRSDRLGFVQQFVPDTEGCVRSSHVSPACPARAQPRVDSDPYAVPLAVVQLAYGSQLQERARVVKHAGFQQGVQPVARRQLLR